VKHTPVVWRPKARADLLALYDWIAGQADPETAFDYTARIEAQAAALATFPDRCTPRDDLVPGMRTIPYRRRTIIAYRVIDGKVEILRLIRAGQDWGGFEGEM
jgi:toxin ParE1/3/4